MIIKHKLTLFEAKFGLFQDNFENSYAKSVSLLSVT